QPLVLALGGQGSGRDGRRTKHDAVAVDNGRDDAQRLKRAEGRGERAPGIAQVAALAAAAQGSGARHGYLEVRVAGVGRGAVGLRQVVNDILPRLAEVRNGQGNAPKRNPEAHRPEVGARR
nr:hypothetical protein [Tanacetum cinerariifolium]